MEASGASRISNLSNGGSLEMETQNIPRRVTGRRFVRAVQNFANSQVGWKAKIIFGILVALLCGTICLNILNSCVRRNFMTSIADRDNGEFVRQALYYVGVFGASTVVA